MNEMKLLASLHDFKPFCSEFKMAAMNMRYLLLLRKLVYIAICLCSDSVVVCTSGS